MGVVGFTCCIVLGGLFLLLGFGVRVFPRFPGGGLVGWTWVSLVFGLSLLLGCGAGTSCGVLVVFGLWVFILGGCACFRLAGLGLGFIVSDWWFA